MNILAFTDLHGNKKYINLILKKSKKADILVCAGDLTLFGVELHELIRKFKKTGKKLLIIPGNHESASEMQKLKEKYVINLHRSIYSIGEYIFVGHGEGGFSYICKDFENIFTELIKETRNYNKVIFVTHQPPFNTKLDFIKGVGHMGSKSYRKFIDKVKPVLAISGHIHENFNKTDKIKNTVLINPGPKGIILKI